MAIDLPLVRCFITALDATKVQKAETKVFASKDVLEAVYEHLMQVANASGEEKVLTNEEIENMLVYGMTFDFNGVKVEMCSGEKKCFASVNYCRGVNNAK